MQVQNERGLSTCECCNCKISHSYYLEDAIEFTQEVGFPIVIKPDIGVGANDTHKINNLQELKQCFMTPFETTMIMEEL